MNAPEVTQSAWVIPLPNDHRPVSRKPPGTRSACPAGAISPAVIMSRLGNTSLTTAGSRKLLIAPVIAPIAAHQPAEASA